MLYILAVEDDPETRNLYEMILTRTFPHEVVISVSGNHAIEIINKRGPPEVIICDDKMQDGDGLVFLNWLKERRIVVPFVICSGTPLAELKDKYPDVYGYVQKPQIVAPLEEMITDILLGQKSFLTYVPVSLSLLLKLEKIEFNLYMKLSYAKYIRVMQPGDTFVSADVERFNQKQVTHLYVSAPDSAKFLEFFGSGINSMLSEDPTSDLPFSFLFSSLELVERMAHSFGWTSEIIESAKKSSLLAMKTIMTAPSILKILKQKHQSSSQYSRHISLLSLMSCCLCQQLGWTSESSQLKLAIAALMHDIAVDDEVYVAIEHWNDCASNPKGKDSDTLRHRNHPVVAVTMLREVKNLPTDIDLIILQHHEAPDGSGFPYKLSANRISPLATVFIITEDLVNFIQEDSVENSVREFLRVKRSKYQSGMFKKVFAVLDDNLKESF